MTSLSNLSYCGQVDSKTKTPLPGTAGPSGRRWSSGWGPGRAGRWPVTWSERGLGPRLISPEWGRGPLVEVARLTRAVGAAVGASRPVPPSCVER